MVFRSLFYGSIPFHLSGADVLCPLPEPLFCLFPALCSGADLCLRDRNTDETGRNARHTRRIPVSDRVFRIRLLLFVLPEYQIQGNHPKKSSLRSPRFLLAYICCMTAILPAHFSGKNRAFPFWKPACVPWLPGYRNRLHHLCRVSCRYAVSKNLPGGLSEKSGGESG